MPMIDLEKSVKGLAERRPLFHSESDFQHELAWQLHEDADAQVRMEYPYAANFQRPSEGAANPPVRVDILVMSDGVPSEAIELKYRTRAIDCEIDSERFLLTDQSAHDWGRCGVWKDVERVETIVDQSPIRRGFVMFLTNDSNYWNPPRTTRLTFDQEFRLHENRRVRAGRLVWPQGTHPNTIKQFGEYVRLRGDYSVAWNDFAEVPGGGKSNLFRYLLFSVTNETRATE